MYSLKSFVAPFFSPLSLSLEFIAIGVILLFVSSKQKTGKFFVALGMAVLVICSYEAISGRILQSLEWQYPPLQLSEVRTQPLKGLAHPSMKWVVVLAAGGGMRDPTLPIQLQISHHSRIRLLEGVRIHRLLPGSKMILTGGLGFDGSPDATTLSRVAHELGVAKSDMVLEVESRDTKDHPLFVRHLVNDEPFILVTSAFHMPRAMKLFLKQGLAPVPAPAGHWKPVKDLMDPGNLFPSARGLRLAELAFHEYLGLVWAWVQGQI